MALNRVFTFGRQFTAGVVAGAISGDPVLIGGDVNGTMGAVCLVDRGSDTRYPASATVEVDGVFDLTVKGANGAGNIAINEGDIIYYVAANTPKLSKIATGIRFGIAVINPRRPADIAAAGGATALLASGVTGTIAVRLG